MRRCSRGMTMLFPTYKAQRLNELTQEQWGAERIPGLLELIHFTQPARVLEIGSFRGVSTEVFALHCRVVRCVDPWPDDKVYLDFLLRVGHYPNVVPIRGVSPQDIAHFPNGMFDLAYIDGDHAESPLCADIFECQRLVKKGGWIAGHDYGGPGTPDVKKVVDGHYQRVFVFSDSSWCAPNE